jgi:hypothetical protein
VGPIQVWVEYCSSGSGLSTTAVLLYIQTPDCSGVTLFTLGTIAASCARPNSRHCSTDVLYHTVNPEFARPA